MSGRTPDFDRRVTMTASTSHIVTRISPEAIEVVQRGAEIQGGSDFVVAAVQEAAQRTICEVEVLRLSSEAQEQFISLLLNPPGPNAALARAFERHRAIVEEQ